MKIIKGLCLFGMIVFFASCSTEVGTEDSYENAVISTRNLGCIQSCNDAFADCTDGNGQEGESHADFYEYMQCRCPEGATTQEPDDNCVWMGNNQNNPDNLSCSELYQLWADYQDMCYISYTICINNCGDPHGDGGEEPDTGDSGPRGDCDGDGLTNWVDPTPGC